MAKPIPSCCEGSVRADPKQWSAEHALDHGVKACGGQSRQLTRTVGSRRGSVVEEDLHQRHGRAQEERGEAEQGRRPPALASQPGHEVADHPQLHAQDEGHGPVLDVFGEQQHG